MVKFFYGLLALLTLSVALLIQIDGVSVLRVAASGVSSRPLNIYLVWLVVDFFPLVTYRFFAENALYFILGSNLLFVGVWAWLKLAFKPRDRYPANRYRF